MSYKYTTQWISGLNQKLRNDQTNARFFRELKDFEFEKKINLIFFVNSLYLEKFKTNFFSKESDISQAENLIEICQVNERKIPQKLNILTEILFWALESEREALTSSLRNNLFPIDNLRI